jgi:hypothetical protein
MKLLFTTLAALTLSALAAAEGTNCEGNSNCAGTLCNLGDLQNQINQIDPATLFSPGQHIACCGDPGASSGICAFTQITSMQVDASSVQALIQGLIDHGCKKCGSLPFQDNNDKTGELTVNWVSVK